VKLVDFVGRPAWPAAEVRALPGRGKGSLFRDWAAHLERHYGAEGVAAVRAATGIDAVALPDQPADKGLYPIGLQSLLVRATAERWFDGDLLALEPGLRADALASRNRWSDRVMRRLVSPWWVLGQATRIHAGLYDLGRAESEVGKGRARIVWSGARFMAEPTWGVMQAFAIRGLFAATRGVEPELEATPGDDQLVFDVVV
jgi:hypothetical protein